jgi:hypothetical protein
MKLIDFETWKQEAIDYWTVTVSSGVNDFYSYAVTSVNSSYAGTPQYINESEMLSTLTSELNNTEVHFNNYINSTNLLNTFKQTLLSLYSYINNKDVMITEGADPIESVSASAIDIFNSINYELPDYTGFVMTGVSVSGFDGNPISTNTDLLNYKMWYADEELSTPEASATYITAKGYISASLSALDVIIDDSVTSDITNLINLQQSILNSSTDLMVYKVYGKPKTILTGLDVKTILLEDYGYAELLEKHNWTIKGVNS